jgi:hypothetical protein
MCDDGKGYMSDSGYKIDYYCERFGWDGGDCEVSDTGYDLGDYRVDDYSVDYGRRRNQIVASNQKQMSSHHCTDLNFTHHYPNKTSITKTCPDRDHPTDNLYTCSEHFCDHCVLAGACDRTCGYCDIVLEVDVDVLSDVSDTPLRESETISLSPTPVKPTFVCTVILTMTITPSQSMSNTVRWSPSLRYRDYVKSVKGWMEEVRDTGVRVVIVENSGANLDRIRGVIPEDMREQICIVSYHADTIPPERGKGVGEYYSISRAVDSVSVEDHDYDSFFIKITGRYAVRNFVRTVNDVYKEGMDMIVQGSKPMWTLEGKDIRRCEIVGFRKSLIEDIFNHQNEALSIPLEVNVAAVSQRLVNEGKNVGVLGDVEIYGGREGKVLDGGGRVVKHL